jgi:SNF2 family DNA or RNA helicase
MISRCERYPLSLTSDHMFINLIGMLGTPVQNNVDELYSLIRFLAIKPYCDWDEFRNKISTPMKRTKQYGPAMQRVQALLKAVCLRRTKKCQVDGKPILDLPDRNVLKMSTPFSDDERAFYNALEQRTRERFNAYVRAGTVMKNYSNVSNKFPADPSVTIWYIKYLPLTPIDPRFRVGVLDLGAFIASTAGLLPSSFDQ